MIETIRIFIADDHTIVRKGIQALITTEPGMEVVGEADNGQDAVQLVRTLKPDVILMDLMMPKMGGIEAIDQITREDPAARVLALTSFAEDDKIFPAIKAGALGYLLKDVSPQQLLQAIRDVYRGESSLDPAVALKLINEMNRSTHMPVSEQPLTEREVEVLKRVAQGLTNQEIANALHISERTARNHVGNILNKLHLANRTQATLYALREGLASLNTM
ncbi:MAG: response regulator transcription factor [Chloroflexales bacterium]|nr:response regulator transcription factor [Chloroflexales bacterium]